MPGLFGLVNVRQSTDLNQFLTTVSRRLSHQPWYESETWIGPDQPIGIGRIWIGVFNREHQPIAFPDGSGFLWLCGELYQTQGLAPALKRNLSPDGISDPDLALAAYQEYGFDFARHLNGVFFIVIYDHTRQVLVIANDRFGLYPHYYHVTQQQLVFAPEVKGVLCAPGIERKPDLTAACEYFRFQQLIGEKTFHEGISLFPYGSVAQYDLRSGRWAVERYWDWDCVPYRPDISFEEAVQEAGSLLQQAVVRQSEGIRPGVFLSGGLDSRTLLGFIPHSSSPPITATYGPYDSRDVVYARQIARAAGSRHYWFDLPDGKWVLENVDQHLKLTEGFHSWIHMHGISILKDLRLLMDCNLTGWDGGTVMGHLDHINDIYNHPVDEWTVALRTYQQFTQAYTWPGLSDTEEHLLFTPEFGSAARGRAFESLLAEFSRFWNFRREYAAEYFYVVNHCWRFTQHMITTLRSSVEARFPYWSYELIDFLYSLPPEIRRDQLMFRTIITRRLPRLALIPFDKQEYLPTVQPVLFGLQKASVWGSKKLGLFPARSQLNVDYENYLRNELREWAEDILFSSRTNQRGLFNLDFVRSLMNRHIAGHENWTLGKIAPLITYEMVMREYFD